MRREKVFPFSFHRFARCWNVNESLILFAATCHIAVQFSDEIRVAMKKDEKCLVFRDAENISSRVFWSWAFDERQISICKKNELRFLLHKLKRVFIYFDMGKVLAWIVDVIFAVGGWCFWEIR